MLKQNPSASKIYAIRRSLQNCIKLIRFGKNFKSRGISNQLYKNIKFIFCLNKRGFRKSMQRSSVLLTWMRLRSSSTFFVLSEADNHFLEAWHHVLTTMILRKIKITRSDQQLDFITELCDGVAEDRWCRGIERSVGKVHFKFYELKRHFRFWFYIRLWLQTSY